MVYIGVPESRLTLKRPNNDPSTESLIFMLYMYVLNRKFIMCVVGTFQNNIIKFKVGGQRLKYK